ncbi:hypothetical protein B484DRAFT_457806 [Ochromonadaceae sp. CCMP2298]|nr:hypothetical protein B484DRAFT_457806 [Ochromonadaceae sp. CCMP2298]
MLFRFLIVAVLVAVAAAMPAVDVVANVRGKKYEISAESVEEFSQQVESLAGLEASQQSVLFRGKVLEPSDNLEDLGVASGDILNVLKGRKMRAPAESMDMDTDGGDAVESMGGMGGMSMPDMNNMSPEEAMKNMSPEQMQAQMQQMDKLLDSEFIDDYFGNEDKIEAARLQMLGNIDQYDKLMPGYKEKAMEIASDPEKWREAMESAKEQIMKLKETRDAYRAEQGEGGQGGEE